MTFDPQSFVIREPYDITKNIRMSNVKEGKTNVHVQTILHYLASRYPAYCFPGDTYDGNMIQAVCQWQRELGQEETGILTKGQAMLLSELPDADFTITG